MSFKDLKIQLKNLIQQGHINTVFEKINEYIDKDDKDISELYNDFILISNQYKNLWRNKLILSNEEINIQQNKISSSLIIFIDKFAEIEVIKEKKRAEEQANKNYPTFYVDFNSEINRVKTDMIDANSQVIGFYQTLINLKNEIEKIEQNAKIELTNKQEQVKELNSKKEKLEKQIIAKEREYEKLKAEFDTLTKNKVEINDLNKKFEIATEEIIRLKSINELLSGKYDNLIEQNANLTEKLNEKEKEYIQTSANLQILEERFGWDAKVVENLKNEVAESKKREKEIESYKSNIYEYKNEVNLLKQEIYYLKNNKNTKMLKIICLILSIAVICLIIALYFK